MAMTVQIDEATGATPTWNTAVTSCVWNDEDTVSGTTTEIPTPTSTGTNFSFVKTFSIDITVTNSLTMTNVKVGKVANETTTGTKLWVVTSHTVYTQATASPTATSDNNVTAPTVNGATASAMSLIASASVYAAGPYTTTGRVGNMVEITLGVDASNTTGGTAVATPVLRWSWVEG
ncbi:MAG: hypothetical protein KGL39_05415 [Patescibacteria group bacterium]|nr:hypothetical protein [Patescibacteria group bacterium]